MDKKERVKTLALSYYLRKDIIDAIYDFSKNREISPRYFDGFGKRPDSFQYPSDISAMVKKGATSFHCSEEIWSDPLAISVGMDEKGINENRIGWDLIIDIDCKWIDYSKKAAISIIRALEFKGVKNIGIKFSGSKGFHIIVPWSAFPDEFNGIKTKDMFPIWPRAILGYLKELSRPILEDLIKDMKSDLDKIGGFTGIRCENCKSIAQENFIITLRCEKCYPPYIESFKSSSEYKQRKCPNCKKILIEKDKTIFYKCTQCNTDSISSPKNFNQAIISTDIYKLLGLDVMLVSPRHLFRMPYSLHEKTALASIVIPKDKVSLFEINDANPFNAKVLPFYPQPQNDEAKELLRGALDWFNSNKKEDSIDFDQIQKSNFRNSQEFKPIKLNINDIKEDNFPPAINKILKGMADGKKRSLFILLNFYRSLGLDIKEVEKLINEWNKKNTPPLRQGYINAQLIWHTKHKPVLPPNFDNEIYKEIGVYDSDSMSEKLKNPINYVLRKTFSPKKTPLKKSGKLKQE